MDGDISFWVADECNPVLGQECTLEKEETHAHLVRAGKTRELEDWDKFDVYSQYEHCKVQKQIVQTR